MPAKPCHVTGTQLFITLCRGHSRRSFSSFGFKADWGFREKAIFGYFLSNSVVLEKLWMCCCNSCRSIPAASHFSGGGCSYNQQCCAAKCVGDSEHESSASCQSRCDVQQVLEHAFNSLRVRLQVYLLIITSDRKGWSLLPLKDCLNECFAFQVDMTNWTKILKCYKVYFSVAPEKVLDVLANFFTLIHMAARNQVCSAKRDSQSRQTVQSLWI